MRILIRVKARSNPRWRPIADALVTKSRSITAPASTVGEDDDVRLHFAPQAATAPAIRVYVGAVLVASTIVADRVLLIKDDGSSEIDPPPLVSNGDIFGDWMGVTELAVHLRAADADPWQRVFLMPVAIAPSKLRIEEFDRLFVELKRDSAAVLMDIYGKTHLGLKSGAILAPSAPVAVLRRVRIVDPENWTTC